ncbi:hypothetical protein O7626_10555 [Micromonospora sp. WMMD1102]|uniref:hypothetical protein n=1 Tax=Micromonospora sp. WMMD1102 TaxID=3016105 RepID=UPI0024154E13|nr:hypothetical protein [Micromonospora sp. WMMD1102]MDG4786364.1 hypothetical protein [Micromonospora sp. WMMD1102]
MADSTPVVTVVTVLVTAAFAVALLGAVGYLVSGLLDVVFNRGLHGHLRKLDSVPAQVAYGAVHLPVGAALGAVFAGLGINLLTAEEAEPQVRVLGVILPIAGVASVYLLGVGMARRMQTTAGLSGARHRIAEASRLVRTRAWTSRQEVETVTATLGRIGRVGVVLRARGQDRRFFRWVRNRGRIRPTLWLILGCHLLVDLFFVFGVTVFLIAPEDPGASARWVLVAMGLSTPVLVAGLLLSWTSYRWVCRRVGDELVANTERLLPHLHTALAQVAAPAAQNTADVSLAASWRQFTRTLGRTVRRLWNG